MRTSARALSRRALDSQADVETTLYKRPAQAPSGIQRIVPLAPPVPSRILEVKQPPRRRAALGLNVFLMPRSAADPAPPWAASPALTEKVAPRVVVRRRSRGSWAFGVLAFVIAFVAVASPNTRHAVIDRSRPYAARAWSRAATFTVQAWHALHAVP